MNTFRIAVPVGAAVPCKACDGTIGPGYAIVKLTTDGLLVPLHDTEHCRGWTP